MESDVIVVGAGPVGLLTAIELRLGGVRVALLERLPAPSPVMKAFGIGPLGCEALERRGMGEAIVAARERSFAAMKPLAGLPGASVRGPGSKLGGHFAGLPLLRRDVQREPERHAQPVDQQSVEAMLGQRASALGIQVSRGCEVTQVVSDAEGVIVHWLGPNGPAQARCGWLVGCDGGRSGVRKAVGFNFPGTPPTLTLYQAAVEIDHPERLLPVGWHRTPEGVFSHGFLPGRLVMLDFTGPPADRQAPVTMDEVERVLRRISGADIRVAALHSANRWTDHTRLVDTYRRGRVLLAGDAAHIHSPFGGQGLSLGLVDAANLGWKLAAVVRGEMPETLLDSYTAERRPAAEAVLANTLAQLALLRPDPQSGAMRALMAELLALDDVNRRIGEIMNGLATRYDLGSDDDEVGRLIGDRPLRHEGRDTTLYALMQDGGAVLLDASADRTLSRLAEAAHPRIRCVGIDAGPSLLIRPDACVAWRGESLEGLGDALRRWFNPTLV